MNRCNRTHLNRGLVKITLYIACCLLFTSAANSVSADNRGLDAYLLYTLKDKTVMLQLKESLEQKQYRVKKFALDLMALADYSAKQKKTAKFNTAKVVVIVTSGDSNVFIDPERLNNRVIVDRYSPNVIKTIERYLHKNGQNPS